MSTQTLVCHGWQAVSTLRYHATGFQTSGPVSAASAITGRAVQLVGSCSAHPRCVAPATQPHASSRMKCASCTLPANAYPARLMPACCRLLVQPLRSLDIAPWCACTAQTAQFPHRASFLLLLWPPHYCCNAPCCCVVRRSQLPAAEQRAAAGAEAAKWQHQVSTADQWHSTCRRAYPDICQAASDCTAAGDCKCPCAWGSWIQASLLKY